MIPSLLQEREAVEALLASRGEKPFRLRQIEEWVWRKGVMDTGRMATVPVDLRGCFRVASTRVDLKLTSQDGTLKRRITLHDGALVESVAIPINGQWTICVSSQTGCAMACSFCATGKIRKFRQLRGHEIVEQALWHWEDTREQPERIVFMGMGEPLANRQGVGEALDLFTQNMGMSGRRITVSTVGLMEGIQWLASREHPVNLALSLHSALDETRALLVPTLKTPVEELVESARTYRDTTGRDVTLEMVLLKGLNDDRRHAQALARVAGEGLFVNLIPYNPGGAGEFQAPAAAAVRDFCRVLEEAGVAHSVRSPRGQDINAACGELIPMPAKEGEPVA
ncbi:MAG: 23S rRNA (adenine(2503)-C(2))-methyltransferase RlmN [Planctomycetota bacterium]